MNLRFVCLVLVFLMSGASAWSQQQVDDGVSFSHSKIEGAHFTIYYQSGVDLDNLLTQLNVSHSDEILPGQTLDSSSPEREPASKVDVLFARGSDILDLHVYSYKGTIKIFATLKELSDYYYKVLHAAIPGSGYAYYLDDYKTIYISAEYFHREDLGHEIGHAIMGAYFVVQPSVKIQEVLAGYIDYQLKKSE